MKKIGHQFMSHLDRQKEEFLPTKKKGSGFGVYNFLLGKVPVRRSRFEWCSVAAIRQSFGFEVHSFRGLVQCIAELGYANSGYNLLYRGQQEDILDKNGRTKILPGIYRPREGTSFLHRSVLHRRLESLRDAVDRLKKAQKKLGLGGSDLYRHPEFYLAILQHYRIRKTPLLDASQSLRVAASFALENNVPKGVLYVLGMPHPQGSISHFIDEDITLVKLQNVCPPDALRPHYQEGYLLGRLSQIHQKQAGDNAAYRLLAKYRLNNEGGDFWDDDFLPIPPNALLPEEDPFGEKLGEILGQDDVP